MLKAKVRRLEEDNESCAGPRFSSRGTRPPQPREGVGAPLGDALTPGRGLGSRAEPALDAGQQALLLTLAFARHLHRDQVTEFLTRHRAIHAARLNAYHDQRAAAEAAGATPRDLITLDFGQRYETAVLDWFDQLPRP